MMKLLFRTIVLLLGVTLGVAQGALAQQDTRAIDVLKSMDAYLSGLDRVQIRGGSSEDARMNGGLIVSNTAEITVSLDRPGSVHFSRFDGVDTRELLLKEGKLTLYHSGVNIYAQVDTPEGVDAGLQFALDNFGVDLPLMDLIRQDPLRQLVEASDEVIYLSDKARVQGVDCHQIAVRTPELDLQLWVQHGDRPVPRRIVITSKWQGGAPRFVANMAWNSQPDFKAGTFDFNPPKDAAKAELLDVMWK